MLEGGGATPYIGIKTYVLLVLRGFDDAEVRGLADQFRKTVKLTNKVMGGEIIDLDTDSRLKESLVQSEPGKALFERIRTQVPVICVSTSYVGDPSATDKVELLRFSDFSTNQGKLFELVDQKLTKDSERSALIEFLLVANKIAKLKPGIAGMSIDLNELIFQWIAWLRRRQA